MAARQSGEFHSTTRRPNQNAHLQPRTAALSVEFIVVVVCGLSVAPFGVVAGQAQSTSSTGQQAKQSASQTVDDDPISEELTALAEKVKPSQLHDHGHVKSDPPHWLFSRPLLSPQMR